MARERFIMVTGSKGFIGRHLTTRLRSEGYRFMEWDEDVRSIGQCDVPVDVVLHLAAVTRHDQFNAADQESYDVNVIGTMAVLNYCKKIGATCVLVSTSGIYRPSQDSSPLREESPVGPTSPYSISKWLAENLCRQQSIDLAIPSVVLRVFNVYGAGQHSSFLLPYIVNSLVEKKPLELRMPNAFRDFVYVDDVVGSLVRASNLPQEGFRIFNIGSGQATRIIDLVHTAESIYGEAAGILVTGPHSGELPAAIADTHRAKNELGWQASYDVKAGLSAMKSCP